jgi:hypothetical protein
VTRFTTTGKRLWTATLSATTSAIALDHHDKIWVTSSGQVLRLYQYSPQGKFLSRLGAAAADDSLGHGIGTINAKSIAFDAHDNIILAGDFTRTFDFAPGNNQLLLGDKRYNRFGLTNIFLSKIRPGGDLVFALVVGGTEADRAAGAGVDRSTGDILLGGAYSGQVDFDPAHHAAHTLDAGFDAIDGDYPSDTFIARYTPTGRLVTVKDHTTVDSDIVAGFAMTPTNAFMAASNFDQKHDLRHIELFELPLT